MTIDDLKACSRGISLGVFAGDAGDLRQVARDAAGWGCRILHFDIMDGVFVPSMTGGPGFVKALDTGQLRDVHLMVEAPARHVASYVQAGADMITVHAEATGAAEAISAIRTAADAAGRPVLAGLGLMPGTPLEHVGDLLDLKPDMILILSLDPRRNTSPDIATACARLSQLRDRFGPSGPVLAFDGGVTLASIEEIAACGPDMIVSGSAVLGALDAKAAFEIMSGAC
jgi:ribulose-phosphate 3-epimerase